MSQSGIAKITAKVLPPEVPTSFVTDSGTAIPLANVIEILGGNNIHTSGLANVVTVSVSGTTTNAVQIGNASGSLTSLSIGTNGQVLIGATGAAPAFASLTSSNNSITFTTGANSLDLTVTAGSVVVEKFALQSGTTPISPLAGVVTFNGAVVAAGTNPVRTDGTGANTMALEVQISQAIAATDATKIGLAAFDSAAFTVDANGFVSTSTTGLLKTLTGNTGGAIAPVANNINTVGTGSITIAGSGSTLTTQLTGLTNHAIQIGAGTATLTQLGAGTTGQVLQTNTTADPTWSTATYPSTTTINQILYSSATNTVTGLATANNGALITNGSGVPSIGTVPIAAGGTNATSMATSNGIVKYDGTRLVTSSSFTIDSSNRSTNTSQPAMRAHLSSTSSNATGDGTAVTIVCNTVDFDQASNYNNGTGTFTCPVAGIYFIGAEVLLNSLGAGHTSGNLIILNGSSVTQATLFAGNPGAQRDSSNNLTLQGSYITKASAGDTFNLKVTISNSTKTVAIQGGAAIGNTNFAVYLIC